mmetsp:Transcript_2526/g.11444  ORF Transcript_2526/g.11444 Transcript_2526/m.11444 type:complete len:205 (-) Transcript_2526:596-1210(-)
MESSSTFRSALFSPSPSPSPSPSSPSFPSPFVVSGSALNTPTILHSRRNPNRVCKSIRLPLLAIVPPHAAVRKCNESDGNDMSPRSIPLVLTSNFSASPSSRHDPAAMDVGANPPIAIGSTTPFSFSSTAIGRRTLNPEAPHSGGIQVPRSRPMSRLSLHLVPTSAVLAEPSRPKRLVTALPRVLARYALYTTANMTDHWKTAL